MARNLTGIFKFVSMHIINVLLKRFHAGITMGEGPIQKIKAAFCLVLMPLFSPICIKFVKFGKNYKAYFSTKSDVAIWTEVFFDEEYRLPDDFFPKKILDLGANAGFSSLYFTLRDPEASILGIEPDPNNFRVLQKNISPFPNIKTKQIAAASQKGEREFFSLKKSGMTSSFIKQPSADIIRVPTISLESLLLELQWKEVDLVKFDIEGAEWEVFENAPLGGIKALIGEYHEDLTGHPVEDFLKLFSSFRYKMRMTQPKHYIIYFFR